MVPMRRPQFLCLPCAALLLLVLVALPEFARAQNALTPPCPVPVARVISFQGFISTRRVGGPQLQTVKLNDSFCAGDVLEVGAYSRAALQLPDQTVVRLDQGTIVTFAAPRDDKRTWLDILKGALHIISRDPRALRVITPFANAGIEGTEFLVQVGADAATVLVFEGRVKVENASGAATAGRGESVLAKAGSAPVLQQVVRPRDQVVWTLYYPPTGAGGDPLVARAEERLAVGRVTEAEADLAEALAAKPGSSDVLARQSVIALTRNDAKTATALADAAVANAPASVPARLAQSYARQSGGDLPGAIATLEAAAADHSADALVRARLAELYLASGDVNRSEASANAAVMADPTLGLARTILGFARLTRVDLAGARDAFNEAIRLEPNAPLPRLGLGLAKIRDGDLAAGREEIETAVILDPNNSLIRSYMGKAYYEEKRDKLAASQLAIAKELDPNDPTPWFYDAIRKQAINRPVEALNDVRRSTELNDSRAVYRSRLLLDDDAAARNASVSAVYSELGFESLAVIEGIRAVADSFNNSSAHRLLASAYAQLPRYEVSRVSEALQAQVRQPLSALPVNTSESQDRLAILRDAGPARAGASDYNSLFSRDQLRLDAQVATGSRGTSADEAAFSGLFGKLGFAISQFHSETDGFQVNNAAEKDAYGALLQYQATPATSIQLDIRHSEFLLGYTFVPWDPALAGPVEIDERTNTVRFNGMHISSPSSTWIWSLGLEDRLRDVIAFGFGIVTANVDAKTRLGEVQRTDRLGKLQLITGGGYTDKDEDYPIEEAVIQTSSANLYTYAQWDGPKEGLRLLAGLALDRFKANYNFFTNSTTRTQVSPKIGVVYSTNYGTTLRAAAFTSVRRSITGSQTLEPTEVAGFNQFFTGLEQFYGDPEGTVSRRLAGAVDQSFGESTFAGIEVAIRELEIPSVFDDADYTWREKSGRAYVYRTLGRRANDRWSGSLSLSADYEELHRPAIQTGSEGILNLKSARVPVGVSFFESKGFVLRLSTSYVLQTGDLSAGIGSPVVKTTEDAWLTDAVVEYRLPKRFGILSLAAKNVFDNRINLIDTDPLNPRDARRRLVVGSLRFSF